MNQADLIIQNGTVLNVYSGELLETNIVIKGERIWYVGHSTPEVDSHTGVLDVAGKVVVPGYIDPHFHPWFTYNPLSLGEKACALGTTTLFCDNLIFYLLMGVDRFIAFMEALQEMPIQYFWWCRAVPQTPMPDEEVFFSVGNLKRLLQHPLVKSLGEITRWQDLIHHNPKITEMMRFAHGLGKRVDGHTAGAKYDQLNVISRVGVESCHEAITAQEVLERLRLGLHVFLRESSLRQDLIDLLQVVTKDQVSTHRIMLTSDSSSPAFYQKMGITDHILDLALTQGVDPVRAYQMVTINPAVYFGMDRHVGGIAPGRFADILVLQDLHHPLPEKVISKGKLVAQKGRLTAPFPRLDWPRFFPPETFVRRRWAAKPEMFHIKSPERRLRFPVVKLISSVITRVEWIQLDTKQNLLDLREQEGLCFLTLLNKEGRWVTNGVVHGFGDRLEGLAASFNTAAEILVVGRGPEAMSAAVNRVLEIKGGIVAVENGIVACEFPLPLGGLMSAEPMEVIAEREQELQAFLSERGYPFHDPLYTLVFLPNDFLPEVRINYRGVMDIRKGEVLWPRREL